MTKIKVITKGNTPEYIVDGIKEGEQGLILTDDGGSAIGLVPYENVKRAEPKGDVWYANDDQ